MIDSEEMGGSDHIFALGFIVLLLFVLYAGLNADIVIKKTKTEPEPVPVVVVEDVDKTSDCLVKFQHKLAVALTLGEPLKRQMTENEIKTLHSISMYECKLMESTQ